MIKKQNFPEAFLQRKAASKKVFEKAQALFKKKDAILGPLGNEENNSVQFNIIDEKKEKVQIFFYDNGLNKSYSCSCDHFASHEGLCSHVTAALLSLNTYESEDIPLSLDEMAEVDRPIKSHSRNDDAVETLLENCWKETMMTSSSLSKETLKIEYSLSIRGSERVTFYVLTMKVGIDYLYVVQDIEQVVDDFIHQNKIDFGKKFSYQPRLHRLSLEDQRMLTLIQDIIQLMQSTSPGRIIASRQDLYVPPEMVQRVIKQLSRVDRAYIHNDFSRPGEPSSLKLSLRENSDQLPLTFYLQQSEDGYYSFVSSQKSIDGVRLFKRADMIYFEDRLYFLSGKEYQVLSYLKEAFETVDGEALIMNADQFSLFASNVLPQMRGLVQVEIDEGIQDMIVAPQLEALLYIDWQADQLYVRPVFKYLNHTIYPFESRAHSVGHHQQIVVRDLNLENEKLEILADQMSDFMREADYALSDRLSQVTQFLYEGLAILADHFTLMMTHAAQTILYRPQEKPGLGLNLSASSNYLDIRFDLEDVPEEDIASMVRALNAKRSFYKMSNGKIIDLKDQAFTEMRRVLAHLDINEYNVDLNVQVPLFKGLSVLDSEAVKADHEMKLLAQSLSRPEDLDFDLPDLLQADLRSYQVTGFKWLKTLDYYGLGGVLADDMGLGKTVQTISFITSKFEEGQGPFLVVCPASVLYNWQHEFAKFTPQLETRIIAGSKEDRQAILQEARDSRVPVWITSYPLIQRDGQLYQDIRFTSMVLDEAQYVKNINTKTAQAVRQINRDQTVALSGTPIENHLGELYSLFSIVMPGLFESPQHFKSLTTQQIAEKIRPFILRRLKSEVLFDLPEKTESTEYIDLASEQKALYQTQIDLVRQDVETYLEDGSFQANQLSVLSGLTRLRQICNDPRLILPDYEGASAKLERLLELLEEARENGKRVVLFSQFTKMLGLIQQAVDPLGIDYHYLDGSTKPEERLKLANQFNMGEKDLFLVSLKAGGTGMNLTGGDTVILYDSWWNPAVEDQAADRVHRFGQKNAVQVIRLISKGTIEERIHDLQAEKRELIHSVIETGEQELARMTKDELLAIIDM